MKGLEAVFPKEEEKEAENEEINSVNISDRFIIDMAYDTIRDSIYSENYRMVGMTLCEIADYEMPAEDSEKFEKMRLLFAKEDYEGIKNLLN